MTGRRHRRRGQAAPSSPQTRLLRPAAGLAAFALLVAVVAPSDVAPSGVTPSGATPTAGGPAEFADGPPGAGASASGLPGVGAPAPGDLAADLPGAGSPADLDPADTLLTGAGRVDLDPGEVAGDDDADFDLADVVPVTVDDPLRDLQWYLDRTRTPGAWDATRGDPDVTVAVIDSGVDPDHPDLAGAFATDPILGGHGYDHIRGGVDTYVGADADWHGTAIAGIVAARADDGFGIAGAAPEVRLRVHRIYESTSSDQAPSDTSYTLAADAIRDATAAGADVILLSWGGTTPNAALASAIEESGVPVVAAAGNDGVNLSDSPAVRRYPAMYRMPNLVTVAASDRDNRILANERIGSNYGVRHVDIAAPGEEIVSLWPGGGHEVFEGTSFAAPQVAAALALGRSLAPGTSASELVGALVGNARRTSSLLDKVAAGGVLDVQAFLRAVERPVCTAHVPPSAFDDVDRTSTHVGNIDCVAFIGVAEGTADGRFAPRRTVTRGQMATFIARTLAAAGHELAAPDEPVFDDIAGTTHEETIASLAATGLVSGVGDGQFAPERPVTRGQMATFLVNASELVLDTELTSELDWFDDVAGNVHENSILVARDLGITLGTSEPREFAPHRDMTREQMASFLARTMDALVRQGAGVERLS